MNNHRKDKNDQAKGATNPGAPGSGSTSTEQQVTEEGGDAVEDNNDASESLLDDEMGKTD